MKSLGEVGWDGQQGLREPTSHLHTWTPLAQQGLGSSVGCPLQGRERKTAWQDSSPQVSCIPRAGEKDERLGPWQRNAGKCTETVIFKQEETTVPRLREVLRFLSF